MKNRTAGRAQLVFWLLTALVLGPLSSGMLSIAEEDVAAIEKRLVEAVTYLAADERDGRGVGTEGLDEAADYIAEQFQQIGLETAVFEETPFQTFSLNTQAKLGENNSLTLVGPPAEEGQEPQRIELTLSDDFTPMSISGSGEFDLPVVFVGYGITGDEEKYDDYADLDVKGKAVIILRHEPRQDDADSPFAGKKASAHAPFAAKVANAVKHEAAAIIFCTDQVEIQRTVGRAHKQWQAELNKLVLQHTTNKEIENPTLEQIEEQRVAIAEQIEKINQLAERLTASADPVVPFRSGGRDKRDLPIFHCRRAVLDPIVQAALGTDMATLEEQIDEEFKPKSGLLEGWTAVGSAQVEQREVEVKNVVGVLEGEGPLAEETIVIGAHYDHVGVRTSTTDGEEIVYNGADDNASGTVAIIEIARQLAAREEKLRRRVVFIAFAAEERGLIGSSHYVSEPAFPLESTVAMLNLDMIGRLTDEKLIVGGTGSAAQFDAILKGLNESYAFDMTLRPKAAGNSDHAPFARKEIPSLHFFTGIHPDYHKPTDDVERLDISGMRRIGQMVEEMAVEIAQADERMPYQKPDAPTKSSENARPYFGITPDFAAEGPGLTIGGTSADSPAETAGLKAKDTIIKFGETTIGGLEDLDTALRQHKSGDKVAVVVKRGEEEKTFEATLGDPR